MTHTFFQVDSLTWATEEQLDGTPDWQIYRDTDKQWYAKGRTSALRCGPFKSRALATAAAA